MFQFTIIDDDIPEDRLEYFEIDLVLNTQGNGRNGYFFPDAIGRVTIRDNDIRKFIIIVFPTVQCNLQSHYTWLVSKSFRVHRLWFRPTNYVQAYSQILM